MANGVFIDIFSRLNLASFAKTFGDVQRLARESGEKASKDFAAGSSGMFGSMTTEADAAFREMQISLGKLQIAEAQINAARLENFGALNTKMVAGRRAAVDSMIGMQRELDASIAESQRLAEAAAGKQAEAFAAGPAARGGGRESGGRNSVARAGNVIGAAGAVGGAIAFGDGLKIAAQTSDNLNDILTRYQDTAANMKIVQDGVYKIAGSTGFSPQEVSKAAEAAEQAGYKGQQVVQVVEAAAKAADIAHTTLGTALGGMTTTMQDFGVKALAGNPDKSTEFLKGINDIAGKFVVTVANLKDVNPAEYFKSLANIEPIAAEYMSGVDKIQATTQVDTLAAIFSQIGMPPERAMLNTAQSISKMGNAKGKQAGELEQLGIRPNDLSVEMRDQGMGPVLHTIRDQIQKRLNPKTGLYDMGWHINDAGQLHDLQQMAIDELGGLGDQGKAGLDLIKTEPFQAGTAGGAQLRKAFAKAGVTDPDVTGAVKSWLQLQQKEHGPSQAVKSGQMPELTLAQVVGNLTGTGDVQRNMLGALQNLDLYDSLQPQYAKHGTQQGFNDAFSQWSQTLDPQIKILGGQLKALAGELGEHLLPSVLNWSKDINEFLTNHKKAAQVILDGMLAVGGIWAAWKIGMGAVKLVEGVGKLASGAMDAAGDIKNGMPNWGIVRTGTETLAAAETTAAGEIKGAGLGGAMKTAAGNFLSVFSVAALGALLAKEAVDMAKQRDRANAPPAVKKDLDDIDAGKNPAPGWGSRIWPGKARGGIVGYSGGTWHAGEQPLMGQPDTGGDSILGTVGGMPIGLRGGEGILTPSAVARMGGKSAIDDLNDGGDPWSNPMNVGTTFFGSFAEGVAKYSPWGKFLTGPAQTLKSLAEQSEKASGMNQQGFRPSEKMLEQEMLAGMSPEQLAAAGITRTKKGGWKLPDGSYISSTPGGVNGIQTWLRQSLIASGLSPDEARGILAMNRTEGGANDPMSILGFTEGQAPGPGGHLQAFMGQWNDPSRRGEGGSIPGVGQGGKVTDWNAYMTWIRQRIVGQNGAASDWQGNAQPAPGAYQQGLMGNLGKDDPKYWFSRGGVIPGYDIGGIIGNGGAPLAPPPAPKPPPSPGPQFDPTMGGNAPWDKAASGSTPPRPKAVQVPSPAQDQRAGSGGQTGANQPAPLAPPKSGEKPTMGAINPQGEFATPKDPEESRQAKDSPSRAYGQDNESKGFGISGGLIGTAESAAAAAASMTPAGPAGSAAANAGFQLANRAIGYAGQLVGIGISGVMETLLPNNSPLADPGNNIFGKMAMGISGMHPTNMAKNLQQSAPALNPKQDLDQGAQAGALAPQVHMPNATIHNHGDNEGTTDAFTKALNRVNGGLPAGMGGYGG